MKTILDDCYSLSLAKAVYRNEGELRITLVELVKSETKENIEIGTGRIIKDVYAIEETQNSRTFLVEFEYAIFHQIIDESFIIIRKEEVKDTKGFIQKIENSNFEKYISENFGWYEDVCNSPLKCDRAGLHLCPKSMAHFSGSVPGRPPAHR
ncbi:hypothetical protein [Phaeodactylibacter luteus]|uniref:Uncharacterized protein n=1 Tax=Phaeodactylibacter luteus TaxID=1564516 RepID=A0A5C6RH63_9BACT|nr:hypothetical protein [Phaeodactylibacter luteus]TXB61414.1 hypothetical protein FRY97_19165 [Phaeodactylibacter luteus]